MSNTVADDAVGQIGAEQVFCRCEANTASLASLFDKGCGAEGQERLGEVDDFRALWGDGERSGYDVSFLR